MTCATPNARDFRFFLAKTCRVFGAENLKIDAGNAKFRFQKMFTAVSRAANNETKTIAFPNMIFADAQRRTRAVGEFCAENCRVFGAENLKNRCRKCKNSFAERFARILRSSIGQQTAQMGLHDVRNAERARFSIFSAKICRVFGAENLKNRCRKCRKSAADKRVRIFVSNERQNNLQMRVRAAHDAECERFSKLLAKIFGVFDAENLKNRRRKRGNSVANILSAV